MGTRYYQYFELTLCELNHPDKQIFRREVAVHRLQRKLNRQTVCNPYSILDINSQLNTLVNGKILNTLDFLKGFCKYLIEEAKLETTFVIEEATAQFERMLFGLQGALGEFQKLINLVFTRTIKFRVLLDYTWTTSLFLSLPLEVGI